MNKNLLVLGGTFNPPTLSHEAILKSSFDYALKTRKKLLIIPSGDRLDKQVNLPPNFRLKLINAMLKDCELTSNDCTIDTRELLDPAPTQTYKTIASLFADYPSCRQTWIFGADSIASIDSWENGAWIKDSVEILGIKRDGFQILPTCGMLEIPDYLTSEVFSSTNVRYCLRRNQPIDKLVGQCVLETLRQYPRIYN